MSCPNCECPDSTVVRIRLGLAQATETRECGHCGHRFRQQSDDFRSNVVERPSADNQRVIVQVVRCPKCEAEWPLGSELGRQRCRECGHLFKLIEKRI